MCLICRKLLNHTMTLPEAENALDELIWQAEDASDHQVNLWKAIKDLDVEKLGEILDG